MREIEPITDRIMRLILTWLSRFCLTSQGGVISMIPLLILLTSPQLPLSVAAPFFLPIENVDNGGGDAMNPFNSSKLAAIHHGGHPRLELVARPPLTVLERDFLHAKGRRRELARLAFATVAQGIPSARKLGLG